MQLDGDAPILGVGSDAVLAALATVVRKPKSKRQTKTTRTSSPTTFEFPLETFGPPVRDVPVFNTVVPTVLLKARKLSAMMINNPISAPAEVNRMETPSTGSPAAAESLVLGIGSDAVLASPTTVARSPKPKRRKTFASTSATPASTEEAAFPLISVGPLVADPPMRDVDGMATLDTLSPQLSSSSNSYSRVSPRSEPTSPITDISLSGEDPPSFGGRSRATLAVVEPKPKQPTPTYFNPIQSSNLVDLTESVATPNLTKEVKYQEMTNVSREWQESDKTEWTVSNAVLQIAKVLPGTHVTDPEVDKAAESVGIPTTIFSHIRTEVKRRLKTAVVDYWFNGDTRGVSELVKYVKEAAQTIKIGVGTLHNEDMVRELGVAVGRGVVVQLIFGFKKARDEGLAWVKALLEAGVMVCHSTEKIEWNIAVFDSQILVQGSQRQKFSLDYTMVHTGPIVSAFESQFDKMWKAASKNVTTRGRSAANINQGESPDSEESSELEPGNKRKLDKRTCFPTTLPFLEMMGL